MCRIILARRGDVEGADRGGDKLCLRAMETLFLRSIVTASLPAIILARLGKMEFLREGDLEVSSSYSRPIMIPIALRNVLSI